MSVPDVLFTIYRRRESQGFGFFRPLVFFFLIFSACHKDNSTMRVTWFCKDQKISLAGIGVMIVMAFALVSCPPSRPKCIQLTAASFQQLQKANVPEEIIRKLDPLLDQPFDDDRAFAQTLLSHLETEELKAYFKQIKQAVEPCSPSPKPITLKPSAMASPVPTATPLPSCQGKGFRLSSGIYRLRLEHDRLDFSDRRRREKKIPPHKVTLTFQRGKVRIVNPEFEWDPAAPKYPLDGYISRNCEFEAVLKDAGATLNFSGQLIADDHIQGGIHGQTHPGKLGVTGNFTLRRVQ